MPRTLRQFVLPAVAGSALTLAVVGLMSMTQVLPAGQHVIVSYGPNPRDMVVVREGTPYIVPTGKLFVVTGVGTNTITIPSAAAWIAVNGQPEASGITQSCGGTEQRSIIPLPDGLSVPGGSTIEAMGGSGLSPTDARVWGYLANQ